MKRNVVLVFLVFLAISVLSAIVRAQTVGPGQSPALPWRANAIDGTDARVAPRAGPLAVSGDLDTTFGTSGKYLSTLSGESMFGPAVAVAVDGRIIVAGKHFNGADDDFALLKLTAAGALDRSPEVFSFSSGKNEDAKSVLALADGRIVMGGEGNAGTYAQHGLMRFLSNGSLDTSFGSGGKVSIDFGRPSHMHEVIEQLDGKLVVIGDSYGGVTSAKLAMARLNVNGSLDTTFGTAGLVQVSYGDSTNGHTVVVDAAGRLTVGGYLENTTKSPASACFVARFTASGAADTTFGTGGSTVVQVGTDAYANYCHHMVLQSDGKVVLAGGRVRVGIGDFIAARFTTAGQLDTTFDGDGVVTTAFNGAGGGEASTIVLQPDGKLILGGYANGKFALARYGTTGALDTSFGNAGTTSFAFGLGVNDQIKSLALQPDGKIVAAGYTRAGSVFSLAVVRLVNDSGGAERRAKPLGGLLELLDLFNVFDGVDAVDGVDGVTGEHRR